MKHAFLIIAHNEPQVLELLLTLLDDPRNDVYLHIDLRAGELFERFASWQMNRAGFFLLTDRMNVYWGHLSQVQLEYRLFETACAQGPYAYYHLLSGVDLPLCPQDDFHAFFDRYSGREFVGFWDDAVHRRDLRRKVGRYYFFLPYYKEKGHPLHAPASLGRNVALAVQKAVRLRRPQTWDFRKGPNWVSITHAFCSYLLSRRAQVMRRFRYTLCPDEIFVQTLLWNSPFRKNIFDLSDCNRGRARLIDWERGKPYVWADADGPELLASGLPLARKFSARHPQVLRFLRQALLPAAQEGEKNI